MTLLYNEKECIEIGVDEAGRGPLFGPVVTGSVILPKEGFDFSLLKDSKKFTNEKKRQEVCDYIEKNALFWNVDFSYPEEIDKHNILQATMNSMHRSIQSILPSDLDQVFLWVDGSYFKPLMIFKNNKIQNISYECVTKGDSKIACIAAASILAKVHRDNYIYSLCKEHPYLSEIYRMDKHKGYGCKFHMETLTTYGITPWHRLSYKPCQNKKLYIP